MSRSSPRARWTRPSRWLAGGLLLYCGLLVALLLYPFNFDLPLHSINNGAAWRPANGGLVFVWPGLVRSTQPPQALYDRLAHAEGLSVELWVRSDKYDQTGPARIVSYSLDPWRRNVTLGQDGADLVIRLRTTRTDANGTAPSLIVPDVFVPGVMQHIVTIYDLARQRVYVDGRLRLDTAVPGGDLTPWSPDHFLVFGNELTGGRPWIGALREVAFYDRPLDAETIQAHAHAPALDLAESPGLVSAFDFTRQSGATLPIPGGPAPIRLSKPERVSAGGIQILSIFVGTKLSPTLHGQAYLDDVIGNLLLFVPFGILVFALATRQGQRPARAVGYAVVTAAGVSLGAELLQVLLPGRESSIFDLVCNTAGSGAGAVLVAISGLLMRAWHTGRGAAMRQQGRDM